MSNGAWATALTSTRDSPSTTEIYNASHDHITTPATIPLTASATPAAGTTITRIEVYAGPTLIGTSNGGTLNANWITLKPGTQTLTARAIDSNGGISTASVTITVTSAANETITFIHNDLAGSPMAATDINGAIVWKEDYSPYGERKQKEAASSNQHQWFGGKVQDSETGLSYFDARYYDPVVGRFMGVDAVGFNPGNLQSFNRYAYANNNPYKFVDPSGNSALSLVDWYDFGKDVGGLLIDIGIYTAASFAGNKDVQHLASQGMEAGVGAAALSTVGIINPVPGTSRMVKTEIQAVEIGSKIEGKITSREARREAMQDAGIPISQQPISQSKNASGREYTYEVPAAGGGKQTMSVQQQTMDRSHSGQAHWEAGAVKTDSTGATRMGNHGRPALKNDKSKVDY
jgi:RHS repeat-associated protein